MLAARANVLMEHVLMVHVLMVHVIPPRCDLVVQLASTRFSSRFLRRNWCFFVTHANPEAFLHNKIVREIFLVAGSRLELHGGIGSSAMEPPEWRRVGKMPHGKDAAREPMGSASELKQQAGIEYSFRKSGQHSRV